MIPERTPKVGTRAVLSLWHDEQHCLVQSGDPLPAPKKAMRGSHTERQPIQSVTCQESKLGAASTM